MNEKIHYCDEIDGNYHVFRYGDWFCLPGDHKWVKEGLKTLVPYPEITIADQK